MEFLQGKKTYLAASGIVLHQVMKLSGVDIPEADASTAVDVVLAILAFVFRMIAKPKPGK